MVEMPRVDRELQAEVIRAAKELSHVETYSTQGEAAQRDKEAFPKLFILKNVSGRAVSVFIGAKSLGDIDGFLRDSGWGRGSFSLAEF